MSGIWPWMNMPLFGNQPQSPNDQPTYTAGDSVSRLIDAWRQGSNNYPQQLGSNPLSLSGLPQNWQKTPGLSAAQGFAPADLGILGSTASAASRGSIAIAQAQKMSTKLNKLDANIEDALQNVDVNGPVGPMDLALNYSNLEQHLPENVKKLWGQRQAISDKIDSRTDAIDQQLDRAGISSIDYAHPKTRGSLPDDAKSLLAERDALVGGNSFEGP